MIPHRMLSNEFFGNDLKQRVTACRKRLRVNRHQHRLHATLGQSLFTSDLSAPFPAEYIDVRESIGGDKGSEHQEHEAWIRPEQEVGIT